MMIKKDREKISLRCKEKTADRYIALLNPESGLSDGKQDQNYAHEPLHFLTSYFLQYRWLFYGAAVRQRIKQANWRSRNYP